MYLIKYLFPLWKKFFITMGVVLFLSQMGFSLDNKILNKLNLSDEQKTQITTLNEKIRENRKELMKQLSEVRTELRQILKNEDVAKDEVKKILKKIALIDADIKFLQYDQIIEINKVLTAEQKKQLKRLIAIKAKRNQQEKIKQKKNNFKQKKDPENNDNPNNLE